MKGDDLETAAALIASSGGALGRPLHLLASTTSTNDEAQRAAKAGAPHGATWVAQEQTVGRGRRGRTWLSPAGEGLLFSVLLRVGCPPARLPPVALLAGIAVREAACRALPQTQVQIKWPNDVVVGGRKLAGVLVEAVIVGSRVEAVVVGIGINVHTASFPADIRDRATSLAIEASEARRAGDAAAPFALSRATVLADVLVTLGRDLDRVLAHGLGPVRAALDAADCLRGQPIQNDAGEAGIAGGVDDEGRLLVHLAGGKLVRWSAGEVQLIRRRVADMEGEDLRP